MLTLILAALLFPTPPDAGRSPLVGSWYLDGAVWPGWTVHLEPNGDYWATRPNGDLVDLWVGEWSHDRGTLVVRERAVVATPDGPRVGGWQRHEWAGARVTREGRLVAGGGLSGARAAE